MLSSTTRADAEAMIDEIRSNLQEAMTELRSLAHGIFPPLLVSGGLGEALPAAAARAALPTIAEVNVGRHPQEVEAAIYFCCMEALERREARRGQRQHARPCVGGTAVPPLGGFR